MQYGVVMFPTDYAIRPDELARAVESRGFESLWVPEHTHIPASRKSPWPGGGPLPKEYWHSYDPFVALAMAAAVTTKLRLGTGICLVIERDPITLAKEVASLDHLSGGRVLFGIGGGWNAEEMEDHGTAFKTRWRRLREQILAMKELWTKEEAEFHGEFVNFDASWAWPKPVQRPHPPIVVGASPTELHFRHIIEYADVWMPIQGRWPIEDKWAELQRMAADAGRDPATLQLAVFGAKPDRQNLAELEEAGAEWATVFLPPLDRDAALTKLDEFMPLLV